MSERETATSLLGLRGSYGTVLRDAWWAFRMHDGRLLSGALAFYLLMSLAPLGVLMLRVLSEIYGEEAARATLENDLAARAGPGVSQALSSLVERAASDAGSGLALAVTSTIGLMSVFRLIEMLRRALNNVWGVHTHLAAGFTREKRPVLYRRLRASLLIVFLGLSVNVIVIARAALEWAASLMGGFHWIVDVGALVVSLVVPWLLVSIAFRWVPDVHIDLGDTLVGSAITTALVAMLGSVVSWYLGTYGVSSAYGAAGSLFVLLLWLYYAAQAFFFGAEITYAWARHRGQGVRPLPHATAAPRPGRPGRSRVEPDRDARSEG